MLFEPIISNFQFLGDERPRSHKECHNVLPNGLDIYRADLWMVVVQEDLRTRLVEISVVAFVPQMEEAGQLRPAAERLFPVLLFETTNKYLLVPALFVVWIVQVHVHINQWNDLGTILCINFPRILFRFFDYLSTGCGALQLFLLTTYKRILVCGMRVNRLWVGHVALCWIFRSFKIVVWRRIHFN